MGLCSCRRATTLFCYSHRRNVCEQCILSDHPQCSVNTYIQWLKNPRFVLSCPFCSESVAESTTSQVELVRLACLDIAHSKCVVDFLRSFSQSDQKELFCPRCNSMDMFDNPDFKIITKAFKQEIDISRFISVNQIISDNHLSPSSQNLDNSFLPPLSPRDSNASLDDGSLLDESSRGRFSTSSQIRYKNSPSRFKDDSSIIPLDTSSRDGISGSNAELIPSYNHPTSRQLSQSSDQEFYSDGSLKVNIPGFQDPNSPITPPSSSSMLPRSFMATVAAARRRSSNPAKYATKSMTNLATKTKRKSIIFFYAGIIVFLILTMLIMNASLPQMQTPVKSASKNEMKSNIPILDSEGNVIDTNKPEIVDKNVNKIVEEEKVINENVKEKNIVPENPNAKNVHVDDIIDQNNKVS